MANDSSPWKLPLSPEGRIPEDIRKMMMDGFLTSFEDAKAYEILVLKIVETIQPRGHMEWLWVKDISDCNWDLFRARRSKAACLAKGRKNAIRDIMTAHLPDPKLAGSTILDELESKVEDIFENLGPDQATAKGKNNALHDFQLVLERFGLTEDSVQDIAYSNLLPQMEAFDRLTENAMRRRDSALRELDRRRDLASRMRLAIQAVDEAIDAEFE